MMYADTPAPASPARKPPPALPIAICLCRYKLWSASALALMIFMASFGAIVGLLPDAREHGYGTIIGLGMAAGFAVFVLSIALSWLISRRATVRFSEAGIALNPLRGSDQSIAWGDILATDITGQHRYCALILRAKHGQDVVVNCHLLGEPASELQRWVEHWRQQHPASNAKAAPTQNAGE